MSTTTPSTAWHRLPTGQVLQELQTAPGGLSDAEVAQRLNLHGPNRCRYRRPYQHGVFQRPG